MTDPSIREIRLAVANEVHPGTVPALPAVGSGEATLTAEDGVMAWGASSGSGSIVASAGGRRSDDTDLAPTVFYTVPTGRSGLFRLTLFVGPSSENGFGQVTLTVNWPEFAPGTGNLLHMSPGNAPFSPDQPQATFLIGEGDSAPGPFEFYPWWAEEGAEFTYQIDVNSWEGGDYVWSVCLEQLVVVP